MQHWHKYLRGLAFQDLGPIVKCSVVLGSQFCFESLVESDVNRLKMASSARWDEFHPDAKMLDRIDDVGLHMDLEKIEKR